MLSDLAVKENADSKHTCTVRVSGVPWFFGLIRLPAYCISPVTSYRAARPLASSNDPWNASGAGALRDLPSRTSKRDTLRRSGDLEEGHRINSRAGSAS